MAYGPKIIDHYENPRNVGNFGTSADVKTRKDVGVGLVGAPECGDRHSHSPVRSDFFEQLPEQFPDLPLGPFERPAPLGGGPVDAARGTAIPFLVGAKIALLFHGMQQRVERARAELVAVAAEFLDDPLSKDRFARGVVQDVNP